MTRGIAAALIVLLAVPVRGWAEGSVVEGTAKLEAVTPLLAGQPAPGAGFLVSESRLRLYLGQQVAIEACELRVASRDDLLAELPKKLSSGGGWWAENGATVAFATGLLLGVVASVGAIMGARELAKVP